VANSKNNDTKIKASRKLKEARQSGNHATTKAKRNNDLPEVKEAPISVPKYVVRRLLHPAIGIYRPNGYGREDRLVCGLAFRDNDRADAVYFRLKDLSMEKLDRFIQGDHLEELSQVSLSY
jgi:hypothetical protein